MLNRLGFWRRWRSRRGVVRFIVREKNKTRGGLPVGTWPSVLRGLNDGALAKMLAEAERPEVRTVIESEFRRREAWRAPAGRAFWISLAALLVSTIALLVSVGGA